MGFDVAKDMTAVNVLVLHHTNHRGTEKRLADICFVLNIGDTHVVSYQGCTTPITTRTSPLSSSATPTDSSTENPACARPSVLCMMAKVEMQGT